MYLHYTRLSVCPYVFVALAGLSVRHCVENTLEQEMFGGDYTGDRISNGLLCRDRNGYDQIWPRELYLLACLARTRTVDLVGSE